MGGPLAWPRPLPPPLPGEVRGQLARILDSPEFAVPELMRGSCATSWSKPWHGARSS